jgi:hypothetical protein
MKQGYRSLCIFVGIFLMIAAFSNNISAQYSGRVLIIATDNFLTADEQPFQDTLETMGFTTEIVSDDEFRFQANPPYPEDDSLDNNYAFVFVSETVNSQSCARLRGRNVAVLNTDNWTTRVNSMGFVTTGDEYGNVFDPSVAATPPSINGTGSVKIVDFLDNPLAAGFSFGTTVELVTGSTASSGELLNFSSPTVDFIPIATDADNEEAHIIFGLEAGTVVYDSNGVLSPRLALKQRYVAIGIHALAFANMTSDAWKFFRAGVDWIMAGAVGVSDSKTTPYTFNLEQNYPNPFNPYTIIDFSIAEQTHVKLEVFDMLGRKISTLVNGEKPSGEYSYTFSALDLSSGVYIYRLSAGDKVISKTMMLLK